MGLQELQTHTSQVGTVSISLAISTSKVAKMLRAKVSCMIVLSARELTTEKEADRPTIRALKGAGLNLVVLLSEVLHLL